jgi:hypothetical protein
MLLCAASCVWAQSGLNRPALGQMIDRQDGLRPVYGVGGSFHVTSPTAEGVLSTACAGTLCVAKTESSIVSLSTSGTIATPAPTGAAIIFVDATGATIYFPSTQQFGRWQNGSLAMLNLTVTGTVLSVGPGLTIAVERSGIVWIVSSDGTILDSLPSTASAALLTANGVVYASSGGATSGALILRKSDGTELSFPLLPGVGGVQDLFVLGDGYVEARAGGVLYALRTIPGREQLFQLPQPVTERGLRELPK